MNAIKKNKSTENDKPKSDYTLVAHGTDVWIGFLLACTAHHHATHTVTAL